MSDQEFTKKYVSKFGTKLKTKFKDNKIEAKVRGPKDAEAFEFFSIIYQLLDPTPEDDFNVGIGGRSC